MRQFNFCVSLVLGSTLSLGAYAAAPETMTTEPAVWQQHQELINYFGFTERYTCTGIEDKVRDLLLYLGARSDLRVTPLCTRQLAPQQLALVRVNFYSLVPASEGTANAVTAHWAPLKITPTSALFRDRGECELFQTVKDVLTKDFTMRDVQYRTECTPYDTTLRDYTITGEILAPPSPEGKHSRP